MTIGRHSLNLLRQHPFRFSHTFLHMSCKETEDVLHNSASSLHVFCTSLQIFCMSLRASCTSLRVCCMTLHVRCDTLHICSMNLPAHCRTIHGCFTTLHTCCMFQHDYCMSTQCIYMVFAISNTPSTHVTASSTVSRSRGQ